MEKIKIRKRRKEQDLNDKIDEKNENIMKINKDIELEKVDTNKELISYIIDTNIFLKNPYILDKFNKDIIVIIPQKVIDELDGLKKDKVNKNNAEQAIRNIDNFDNKEKLILSPSHLNKLPIDFSETSPDNIILSVVLYYSGILLTNDNGLKIKCNSLNLKTENLSDFQNNLLLKTKKINIELQKELVNAIQMNDINQVKKIITNIDLDINYLNEDGITALILAIKNKRYDIIKILLENENIDIDKVDSSRLKMTPFAYATQKRDLKTMKLLYHNGAKIYLGVNGKNKGNTPLLIAAWDGCLDCIKYILETGEVSINSVENNGFTALIKASIKGHKQIVKYLLNNYADTKIRDKNHKKAIDYAIENNHLEIIKLLEDQS